MIVCRAGLTSDCLGYIDINREFSASFGHPIFGILSKLYKTHPAYSLLLAQAILENTLLSAAISITTSSSFAMAEVKGTKDIGMGADSYYPWKHFGRVIDLVQDFMNFHWFNRIFHCETFFLMFF